MCRTSRCSSTTSASMATSSSDASPDQSGDQQAQPNEPFGIREQGLDDAIPHGAWIHDGRVECLRDLGLETGLLMEADLEVGEQDELRARFRIDFEARPMVASKRLAQVTLTVRGLARFEPLHEPDEGVRVDGRIRAAFDIEARELAADLLEHPQVATGNGGARPIQRGCRIDDAPNERERVADRDVRAESARLRRDLARSNCRGRRRSERRLEAALEILLPDRPSGLLRCPRREGAPVGDLAEARRRRGRKLVIGLRDLEVADHRIGDGRDPINVLRGQRAALGERGCRHGRPAVYRPRRPPNRPRCDVSPQCAHRRSGRWSSSSR